MRKPRHASTGIFPHLSSCAPDRRIGRECALPCSPLSSPEGLLSPLPAGGPVAVRPSPRRAALSPPLLKKDAPLTAIQATREASRWLQVKRLRCVDYSKM